MDPTNLPGTEDEFDYIGLGNRYYKLNDKVLLRVSVDFVLKKGEDKANLNMHDVAGSLDDIHMPWLNAPKPTVVPKGPAPIPPITL